MTQPIPNWITQALEIAQGITDIADKAVFSEAERTMRFDLRKVKNIARVNLKADKLTYRRIKLRIDATLVGIAIAKKEGLDAALLRTNLQKLVDMLSTLQFETLAE